MQSHPFDLSPRENLQSTNLSIAFEIIVSLDFSIPYLLRLAPPDFLLCEVGNILEPPELDAVIKSRTEIGRIIAYSSRIPNDIDVALADINP